ncbi:MAG: tRNA preQ1(34) S-adenosylmethionine ribosyltransferase-isomerase QueA [Oscillospiraceae bacterium]|nr:tRNA preQ1(34) S-adenosylmethionine ribosyltransferase-isomerase QueA [Oscillospiraceae bacterium]
MQKSDFYFELPEELIAQTPIENRTHSRLLCIDRDTGALAHRHFYELSDILQKGDCLILNDSRVIPARLLGRKDTGAAVEVVLLREMEQKTIPGAKPSGAKSVTTWECLVKPGRKIREGTNLIFGNGDLTAVVTEETDGGNRLIEFSFEGIFMEVLERLGKTPLPPYIHEELEDDERYQTVYSKVRGSAAAPTAGLHFTNELLEEIAAKGVEICYMTLHIGLGTFRPVKVDDIEDHKMHAEYFIIPEETAETVNRTRRNGGRVIAVGTTPCRAMEAQADENGMITPFSGFTDIFIYPGHKFKGIDGLITNFHLPESTLIMLVSALCGRENILNAYNTAIEKRYRFFSFGDATIILPSPKSPQSDPGL